MEKTKDYEIHYLSTGLDDPIPSGIIKVKSRISDFIALGGKLILSDPTVATGDLLQQITKEIIEHDVSNMRLLHAMTAVIKG